LVGGAAVSFKKEETSDFEWWRKAAPEITRGGVVLSADEGGKNNAALELRKVGIVIADGMREEEKCHQRTRGEILNVEGQKPRSRNEQRRGTAF